MQWFIYYKFVIYQSKHTILPITFYSTYFHPCTVGQIYFLCNWAIEQYRWLEASCLYKKNLGHYLCWILFFTEECSSPPVCENGGFVNFLCQCVCPTGLTGATCTQIDGSKTTVTIYEMANTYNFCHITEYHMGSYKDNSNERTTGVNKESFYQFGNEVCYITVKYGLNNRHKS